MAPTTVDKTTMSRSRQGIPLTVTLPRESQELVLVNCIRALVVLEVLLTRGKEAREVMHSIRMARLTMTTIEAVRRCTRLATRLR